MLNADIEKDIERKERELQDLRKKQAEQAKKMEGVEKFRKQMDKICDQYDLSREELLVGLGQDLVDWMKLLNKLPERPAVLNDLKSYFNRISPVAGDSKRSTKRSSEPKLEVGTYRNPNTGETIEKIKRNPKPLNQWIEEHGIEKVRSWKV